MDVSIGYRRGAANNVQNHGREEDTTHDPRIKRVLGLVSQALLDGLDVLDELVEFPNATFDEIDAERAIVLSAAASPGA